MNAVAILDEYRKAGGINELRGNVWPMSRAKFRKERAERADLGLREVICLHCEKRSPLLDGPTSRAWWASHKTTCRPIS